MGRKGMYVCMYLYIRLIRQILAVCPLRHLHRDWRVAVKAVFSSRLNCLLLGLRPKRLHWAGSRSMAEDLPELEAATETSKNPEALKPRSQVGSFSEHPSAVSSVNFASVSKLCTARRRPECRAVTDYLGSVHFGEWGTWGRRSLGSFGSASRESQGRPPRRQCGSVRWRSR